MAARGMHVFSLLWLMTMPWSAWLKLIWCRVLLNDTGELDLVAKALPCLALRSSLEVLCRVSICTGLRPPVLTYSYNGYRDGWCSHRMWDKRNTLSRPSHARMNCFCFTTRGRWDEWDAWDETTMSFCPCTCIISVSQFHGPIYRTCRGRQVVDMDRGGTYVGVPIVVSTTSWPSPVTTQCVRAGDQTAVAVAEPKQEEDKRKARERNMWSVCTPGAGVM